jgi:hypothetical protein
MQGFKSRPPAKPFLETHAAVYNTFNIQRRLLSRNAMRVLEICLEQGGSVRATCLPKALQIPSQLT